MSAAWLREWLYSGPFKDPDLRPGAFSRAIFRLAAAQKRSLERAPLNVSQPTFLGLFD